jgi:hypothetical protein
VSTDPHFPEVDAEPFGLDGGWAGGVPPVDMNEGQRDPAGTPHLARWQLVMELDLDDVNEWLEEAVSAHAQGRVVLGATARSERTTTPMQWAVIDAGRGIDSYVTAARVLTGLLADLEAPFAGRLEISVQGVDDSDPALFHVDVLIGPQDALRRTPTVRELTRTVGSLRTFNRGMVAASLKLNRSAPLLLEASADVISATRGINLAPVWMASSPSPVAEAFAESIRNLGTQCAAALAGDPAARRRRRGHDRARSAGGAAPADTAERAQADAAEVGSPRMGPHVRTEPEEPTPVEEHPRGTPSNRWVRVAAHSSGEEQRSKTPPKPWSGLGDFGSPDEGGVGSRSDSVSELPSVSESSHGPDAGELTCTGGTWSIATVVGYDVFGDEP